MTKEHDKLSGEQASTPTRDEPHCINSRIAEMDLSSLLVRLEKCDCCKTLRDQLITLIELQPRSIVILGLAEAQRRTELDSNLRSAKHDHDTHELQGLIDNLNVTECTEDVKVAIVRDAVRLDEVFLLVQLANKLGKAQVLAILSSAPNKTNREFQEIDRLRSDIERDRVDAERRRHEEAIRGFQGC